MDPKLTNSLAISGQTQAATLNAREPRWRRRGPEADSSTIALKTFEIESFDGLYKNFMKWFLVPSLGN